jgi:predicted RNase H-like HicB family nuclease
MLSTHIAVGGCKLTAESRSDAMNYEIEFELEDDGRWIAEISSLPGVMAYGISKADAESKVEAMALRVIADTIERDNSTMSHVHFAAA